MKATHIEKLLRAAKAKTQLDNARLAAIRSFQEKLVAEANELAEKIKHPLVSEGVDLVAADIAFAAKHTVFLQNSEASKRKAAELVEPERMSREAALKTSLREEIAWKRLSEDAAAAHRKEKEGREEEKREALVQRTIAPLRSQPPTE